MSLSEESNRYYSERKKQFDLLKKETPVGIFGSFYGSRKQDLLDLREFLSDAGYQARISDDLDKRTGTDRELQAPVLDRNLSDELIASSTIHIFVLARERADEPGNLIQSVSMELEHLHTLSECGQKSEKYTAVFAETGLIGTMGGVCEGLLAIKEDDWFVGEFTTIQEIFRPARQFCLNCIRDIYGF
jgi:hypothetical protein